MNLRCGMKRWSVCVTYIYIYIYIRPIFSPNQQPAYIVQRPCRRRNVLEIRRKTYDKTRELVVPVIERKTTKRGTFPVPVLFDMIE